MLPQKIAIISAVIYPRNSPRAHRATELAKELSRQGHNVTLYGVLGEYDYSEFESENNLKVKSIGNPLFYPINSDGDSKRSFTLKVSEKILKPFIQFPDIELLYWVRNTILKENEFDILITSAIPHSIHWGAAWAKETYKERFPKVWIADCGDPFMGNEFQKPLFYFKYFEKWFCKKADFITIPVDEAKNAYYKEFRSKLVTIPQGFKFDNRQKDNNPSKNKVPTFLYAGAFYQGKRDPGKFFQYLAQLDIDFKFIIYSKNVQSFESYLKPLGDKVEIRSYIPRIELLGVMSKMDFLINFENSSTYQVPSKLIDYFIVGRPVLSVPNEAINKKTISEFLKGNYDSQLTLEGIEKYDIVNVAKKFMQLGLNKKL